MLIHLAQEMLTQMPDLTSWHPSIDSALLAAQFNENVFSRFNVALDNFIKTGQVWALLAGLIIGYFVRGFTTYG
jgi:hypothetical protein